MARFHVFPADATFPDGWKVQPSDIGFVTAFAACVIPSVTASPVSREVGRRKYSPNGGVRRTRAPRRSVGATYLKVKAPTHDTFSRQHLLTLPASTPSSVRAASLALA